MKLARRDLDPQKKDLQEKLSTIKEGLDKAYIGMMPATEHTCLLKECALNNSSIKNHTCSLLYSSLSILETYIGTLRDDLYGLMTLADKEVHHD